MQVRFKAKPYRVGNSTVVTIPSDFIEQGLVPADRDLQFTVEVSNGGGSDD